MLTFHAQKYMKSPRLFFTMHYMVVACHGSKLQADTMKNSADAKSVWTKNMPPSTNISRLTQLGLDTRTTELRSGKGHG